MPRNQRREMDPSATADKAVFDHVLRDLEPSSSITHLKAATAAVFGSLLALAVCGQFGVGLTSFAKVFSREIHEQMGAVPCALICGGLYSVFPVLLLRFVFCSVLQFRAVLRRRFWTVSAWLVGVGAAMAWQGHHGDSVVQFGAWILAALLGFLAFGKLAGSVPWRSLDLWQNERIPTS